MDIPGKQMIKVWSDPHSDDVLLECLKANAGVSVSRVATHQSVCSNIHLQQWVKFARTASAGFIFLEEEITENSFKISRAQVNRMEPQHQRPFCAFVFLCAADVISSREDFTTQDGKTKCLDWTFRIFPQDATGMSIFHFNALVDCEKLQPCAGVWPLVMKTHTKSRLEASIFA